MTAGRGTWGVTFTAHAGTLPCGSHGSGTDPWRLAPMSGNSPFRTILSARLACGNRFCTLHGSLIWEPFGSGLGPAKRPNRYRRIPSRRYRRFPNQRASRIPGSPPMRSASRLGNRRYSRLETCGTPAHDACKVQTKLPLWDRATCRPVPKGHPRRSPFARSILSPQFLAVIPRRPRLENFLLPPFDKLGHRCDGSSVGGMGLRPRPGSLTYSAVRRKPEAIGGWLARQGRRTAAGRCPPREFPNFLISRFAQFPINAFNKLTKLTNQRF